MLTVCTGWSKLGWLEYGQRFAETFDKFWDPEVRLLVYGEEPRALPNGSGRQINFFPLSRIPALQAFIYEHGRAKPAIGRQQLPGHVWKERAVTAGYNWRYDAVKFSRQAFIPLDALLQCHEGDHLCWLDGDVVTTKPVRARDVVTLLPAFKDVAFLGRGLKHPEIGFQLYRVGGFALAMLKEFRRLYQSGDVFHLKEWHSAYAWAEALHRTVPTARQHDLTPGGSGHVWHQSPLALWSDHLKGERKAKGRSPEARWI